MLTDNYRIKIKFILNQALIIVLVFIISGCAAKRLAKTAFKYEEAGLYDLAVTHYLESLQRKNENNELAQIGLMRASRLLADEWEEKIDAAYTFQNDELVVNTYLDLLNLIRQTKNFRIELPISYKTQGQFEEAKTRFLRDSYLNAQTLLDKEMFTKAEEVLADIIRIDPYYEKASELHLFAQCEPLYRDAVFQMNNHRHRTAYNILNRLLSIDPQFKDAESLKLDAYYNALLTIAFKSFQNEAKYPFLSQEIKNNFKLEFNKGKTPLLSLVATDYYQQMVQAQKEALSNQQYFDPRQIIPVRVWLTGNVLASQYTVTKPKTQRMTAFLRKLSKDNVVSYDKVYYDVYEQNCTADIRFNFEFVNALNGSILTSGKHSKQYKDAINYAQSEHNIKNLYPEFWGKNIKDSVITDLGTVNKMRNLFSARNKLKVKEDFEQAFAKEVAMDIYRKIIAYDPEK